MLRIAGLIVIVVVVVFFVLVVGLAALLSCAKAYEDGEL